MELNKMSNIDKKLKQFKKINGEKPTLEGVVDLLQAFPWLSNAKFKDAVVSVDVGNNFVWESGIWISGTRK